MAIVNPVKHEMNVDEIIKALAHPMRREILLWLKTPEQCFHEQILPLENGVCATRIYERSGLSQSTVSAHLACLQKAGLVSTTKIGQWIFYRRNEVVIEAFRQHLSDAL